jgi:hypothetical protein
MKSENREKMAKAIGMLDALAFVAKCPVDDAITLASDILTEILNDEGGDRDADILR